MPLTSLLRRVWTLHLWGQDTTTQGHSVSSCFWRKKESVVNFEMYNPSPFRPHRYLQCHHEDPKDTLLTGLVSLSSGTVGGVLLLKVRKPRSKGSQEIYPDLTGEGHLREHNHLAVVSPQQFPPGSTRLCRHCPDT